MSLEDRIAMFANMAQADPENELAHFSLGKLRFEAGQLEPSESSLRRTLELNPQHTQAHRYLGEALLAQGKKEEAVRTLEDGVRLAHVRGEYMPRNTMMELLRKEGVEPPRLVEDEGKGEGEGESESESEAGTEGGGFTCRRCLRAASPLEDSPFSNDLGQKILESVCQDCWKEWMAMSIKVINELRLNPATPEGSRAYDDHMKEFLGL